MLGELNNERRVDCSNDLCIEPEQPMPDVATKNRRSGYSSD